MFHSKTKESLPFSYKGYTSQTYSDSVTASQYIKSFDQTEIAVDVTLPVDSSGSSPCNIPAIIMVTRNNRRDFSDFEIRQGYHFVRYGYAFVLVELRGCGVSYGINDSFCNYEHCQDLISTVNWVSEQPWCSGKIGLYGGSNRSFIQLCSAACNLQHVAAITPVVAVSDFYYQNYPNGVSACPNFPQTKSGGLLSKEEFLSSVVPVDADPDGAKAYEAYVKFHYENNRNFFETLCLPHMNRDSEHPDYHNEKTNLTIPPFGKMDHFFKGTQVKQHQFIGQLESGTLGQLAHFIDFGGTAFLGPWTHFGAIGGVSPFPNGDFSVTEANLRWFDYSLKGIDNGWDQAPPVAYYVFHAEEGKEWRFSETWPPENEARCTFYLTSLSSGTSRSANDGTLCENPEEKSTALHYVIQDNICVFADANGKSQYNRSELFWDGDMEKDVDSRGLTFTSAPLFPHYQNEFAGCISVDLWISSSQPDVDLIVYAEEILPDNTSHYIKDGVMRASHRTSAPNPSWEKMGAVWHTSMTEEVDRCIEEGLSVPTRIQFAIDPIAYHFSPGSRIRFTITCANSAAFQNLPGSAENPVLTVYVGGEYPSSISVPFLEQTESAYNGMLQIQDEYVPASLYIFEKYSYLYSGGMWHKFKTTRTNRIINTKVSFDSDRFIFQQTGQPLKAPYVQNPQAAGDIHPFPRFQKQLLAKVPVSKRNYTAFVPHMKNLWIDIYKKSDALNLPCIVYIHGYSASPSYLPDQLKALYNDNFIIACIDVRNYPPNTFPDYIHDAKGALRFLRANAALYGIHPDKIGIYGFSLGGNTSLMLALTGDYPELEGTIGGNPGYSSRVQACAAGFAWSDLLNMGKDIAEEYTDQPDMRQKYIAMTEGEFSPSSEVIDFAGAGKGLSILRKYKENGCSPKNSYYDAKIQYAEFSSPINYVNPSAPPIALFGGYGDPGVNIAFRQSLRTFDALNSVDVLAFLYGNTNGKYGENPETIESIRKFFIQHLAEEKNRHVVAVTVGTKYLVYDYVAKPLSENVIKAENGIYISRMDFEKFFPDQPVPASDTITDKVNLYLLDDKYYSHKYYKSHSTLVIHFR